MKLFKLTYQKSKRARKTVLMVDSERKCRNFMQARQVQNTKGVHEIVSADGGDKTMKRRPLKNGYVSGGTYQQNT